MLGEEFDAPFTFYDLEGEEVSAGGAPAPAAHRPTPSAVQELARDGKASVRWLVSGSYQVSLVIWDGPAPLLVAVALLPSLTEPGPRQAAELKRLTRWAQAVADRLKLAEKVAADEGDEGAPGQQARRAWSVVLGLNDAIRRARSHSDLDRAAPAVLNAALPFLKARALVWAPAGKSQRPILLGDPVLATEDVPHLAALIAASSPRARAGEPVVWNEDSASRWSALFPAVSSLLAAPIADGPDGGWLIALNRVAEHPPVAFRRSDVAAFLPFASLLELQVRVTRRNVEQKELLVGLTRCLTAAIDARAPHTAGHSERVARVGVELGRELGLAEADLNDVYLAGLLHDVGMIGVPEGVLYQPGSRTAEEEEQYRQHVTIGHRILSGLGPFHRLLPAVLSHHERFDGQGYPGGLAGEQVPLLARIIAVADASDVMAMRVASQQGTSTGEVEMALQAGAGLQWDPRVVEAYLRCGHRIDLIRQRLREAARHQAPVAPLSSVGSDTVSE